MYCEYLRVRSLYPCSAEEHAAASRLQCAGFDESKRPVQNGKRLTWWIFLHCSCQRGSNLSEKRSIAWQCHQSDTTVTSKTWGIYSKERSIKELKEEAESLGWRVAHKATLHCFRMNWWFWYLVIAVSIGWFMVIPRRFLEGMSINLDGCPPKKVGSLVVWLLLPLGFWALHVQGFCWENLSL